MWSYSLEISGHSSDENTIALIEDDSVGFVAEYLIPLVQRNSSSGSGSDVVFRKLPNDTPPTGSVIMHGKATSKVARWTVYLTESSTYNFLLVDRGERLTFSKKTTGRLRYKKQSFRIAVKSISEAYVIDHNLSTVFFDKEWYICFETSADYVQATLQQ